MYNQLGLYSSFMKKRVDEFLQLHKFYLLNFQLVHHAVCLVFYVFKII